MILSFIRNILQKRNHNKRTYLAKQYLSGEGIEIGALHLPLVTPRSANVKYVDRMTVKELRQHYPELKAYSMVHIDIIDDGEKLEHIVSESQDFVIANHFLEHCINPIGALKNFFRVLKKKGILFLAVPDKRLTFDVDRPITKLEHLLKDYKNDSSLQREHYKEWVQFCEKKISGKDIDKRIDTLIRDKYSIHFHIWTYWELFELLFYIKQNLNIDYDIKEFVFNDYESIFILKKIGHTTSL